MENAIFHFLYLGSSTGSVVHIISSTTPHRAS